MATNDNLRQASVRAATGTAYYYNDDWMALFSAAGITSGTFNDRMRAYLNARMGTSYLNINDAMKAFATSQGFSSWGAMGTFDASGTPAAPVNINAPSISGANYYTGTTLTADPGLWSGSPASTYTYQWERDGSNISSATNQTYVLVSADETHTITVAVTATNTQGNATATSAGIVAAALPVAPAFTVSPSISGSPIVGQTLTGSDGTITGSPTPSVSSRVWKAAGTQVGTGTTYLIQSGDVGKTITFSVTATNSQGTTTQASAATSTVASVPATNGLVIEGDSLMVGYQTTNGPISALYTSFTGQTATSRATSGDTLVNMDSTYATDVAPYYNASTANTLFIEGGTNDLNNGTTAATLQTTIQSIAGKARATGFVVAVSTVATRSDSANGWNSTKNTVRGAYNTWLRANYTSFADYLVDIDAISQLSDSTNTAYFNADQLHWTNATNGLVADAIRSTLGVASISDTIPDAFTFTDVTGATTSTVYTSNAITVTGINAASVVTISGGTYSKNGGSYTSASGTAANGDTFTVQGTASASAGTSVNVVLTIGGISDTYAITTAGSGAASAWNTSDASTRFTLSNSNRTAINLINNGAYHTLRGDTSQSTGKMYIEFVVGGSPSANNHIFGLTTAALLNNYAGETGNSCSIWQNGGFASGIFTKTNNAALFVGTAGDVVAIAVDFDAGKVWFAKNNSWTVGSPSAGTTPNDTFTANTALFPAYSSIASTDGTITIRGDAGSQSYTPPTGFSAWG